MTDLFVPPSKTPAALGPVIDLAPGDLEPSEPEPVDLEASSSEGIPPIETSGIAEPIGLVELTSVDAGDSTDSAHLGSGALALPAEATMTPVGPSLTIAPVDSIFFYGRSATGPVLYQVDLELGSLAAVTEPVDLFSTTLDGVFTSVPGGLGGSSEASATPTDRLFTLVEGTSGKNFLIGTAADNALLAFGSDDLILTGSGDNLAFGGSGNDTLVGGAGNNGLFGGDGDDAIEGGAGADLLAGGAGSDILYGGGGANTLIGGAGADVFRLNSPGAYGSPEAYGLLVSDATAVIPEPDSILDFNAAEGDLLDLSLIAAQPLFGDSDLLPFVSFVQVEADTHVQITTPLGQISTEAILLNVQADTLTPASLTFTPPVALPLLK